MADSTRTRAARDGSRALFVSLGVFGDASGTGISTEYMAQRSAGGWDTHSITPLHDPQDSVNAIFTFDPRYVGDLSDDLSTGVYRSQTPLGGDTANVEGVKNLFVRRDLEVPGTGAYELLTGSVTAVTAPAEYMPLLAGASADFSHVVFASRLNLTADAPAQSCTTSGSASCDVRAYEWAGGVVRLVGLVPVAPATSCSGVDCVPAVRSIPGALGSVGSYSTDIISPDGEQVFFTVGLAGVADGALFVREGGESTTQVNVSEHAGPGFLQPGTEPATFSAASDDGSKVFFTTREQLTDEPSGLEVKLYRADLDAPVGQRLQLVSVDSEPNDPLAYVDSIFGVSADGAYVYFSAASQLVAGEQLLAPGETMVYGWHDGEGLTFVSSARGFADTNDNASPQFLLARRQARVSPDGRSLLFMSRSSSVGVGSSAVCGSGGLPCRRLYLFRLDDAGVGPLSCVSCPASGPATTDALTMPRVGAGGSAADPFLNHPLTDDGRRVFFSTGDPLVPEDRNGSHYDVYEFDVASGTVHLISPGVGGDSYFMDASASGDGVFFTSRDRLVGWDTDDNIDLYDARVGGGFPEPVAPPAACPDGEACKGVVGDVPGDPVPGSFGFLGSETPGGLGLPVFHAQGLGRAQRARLAAGGRATIAVRVSEAGRVRVQLAAKVGGRSRAAGGGVKSARRGGTVHVAVKLAPWALRRLRVVGRLRLSVSVSFGPVVGVQRQQVVLRAQRGGVR